MGSIYGSHYRSIQPDSLDRLPTEAANAAHDSAAAGLHVADELTVRQGTALLDGIKAAFMDGLIASLIAVTIHRPGRRDRLPVPRPEDTTDARLTPAADVR